MQVVVQVFAPEWQRDTIISRVADSVKWLDEVDVVQTVEL